MTGTALWTAFGVALGFTAGFGEALDLGLDRNGAAFEAMDGAPELCAVSDT